MKSQLKLTPLHGSTSRKKVNQIIFNKTQNKMNTKTTYPTNPFKTVEEWRAHIKSELNITKESNKITKQELVKAHLIKNGHITSWEAINLYFATRLSAIIFNLRHNENMAIGGDNIQHVDAFGNKTSFKKYTYKQA
jgi:hypothetical protein